MPRLSLLIFLASLGSFPCTAQGSSPRTRPERLVLVQALQDPMPASFLPTYYTPGSEQRARALQTFVEGERSFYQDKLGIKLDDLSMAVLRRNR